MRRCKRAFSWPVIVVVKEEKQADAERLEGEVVGKREEPESREEGVLEGVLGEKAEVEKVAGNPNVEGGGEIAAEEKPAVEPDDYQRGGTERGDSGGEGEDRYRVPLHFAAAFPPQTDYR